MSTILGLLVVIALVAANAFFVAVEFSLVASDRTKLEGLAAEGSWSARVALGVLKRLSFHLSGAQLGITVSSLVLGFLAEPLAGTIVKPPVEAVFGSSASSGTVSVVIALVLATVFQMVAGELIPKNIAIARPERVSLALSPLARVVHGVLSPVIVVFNGAANWTVARLGIEPTEELATRQSIEELAYLIRSSGDSGALDPDAHDLLTRTLRFGDKTAADALTPRVHVRAVPVGATIHDLVDEVSRSHHSRYPVYGDDLDDVRGIATIGAVLRTPPDERASRSVESIMREPLVVPETRDLIGILSEFRTSDTQIAVVIDEHGGTAGILTLEDVLEEIVGDVDDEHDVTQAMTVGVAEGVFVVAGTLHLDEVADASGLELPEGHYETVAGFVLQRLGRIPVAGDNFTYEGWEIEVVEMDSLRIASLQLVSPRP